MSRQLQVIRCDFDGCPVAIQVAARNVRTEAACNRIHDPGGAAHGIESLADLFVIESPGPTSSLAISEYVCQIIDHEM